MMSIIAASCQMPVATTASARGTDGQSVAGNAATKPAAATPSTGSSSAATAFAQNKDQFDTLTSTVLGTSDRYSYDQRLQAYSSLLQMGAKGQLRGMGGDSAKLYAKVTVESDIGTKVTQVRQDGITAMIGAAQRGQSLAVAKLKFFAGLPPEDQKVDLTLVENGSSAPGGRRQDMDFDSFRNQMATDASQDLPDQAGKALKALCSGTAGNAWGVQVMSLLKVLDPAGSGTDLAAGTRTAGSTLPASYQPGGIFTQLA